MSWQSFDINASTKIAHKLVDTKTPHLKKLIIKSIPLKKRNITKQQTAIFLVRDGFIVKGCTPNSRRFLNIAYGIGFKKSIHSLNIGALFKKYEIPKSTGKIIMNSIFIKRHIHNYARNFHKLVNIFGGSIDNANKVLATVTFNLCYHLRNPVFHDFMGRLSAERKISMLIHEDFLDTFYSYRTIYASSPDILNLIDWRRSAQNLHDYLYKVADRINNPDRDIPIPYEDNALVAFSEANGRPSLINNNLSMRLAKDGNELLEWGTHLHHCVGGYTKRAIDGASHSKMLLVGIFESNNKMPSWVLEVRTTYGSYQPQLVIVQFCGLRNSAPPDNIESLINEAISTIYLKD